MFRKKTKPQEPVVVQQVASIVAADCEFFGDIKASNGLLIDGVVNGNVDCGENGMLMVSKDGRVNGNVNAKLAIVDGAINGDAVFDRAILNANAKINGKVSYNLIRMAEGAEVDGSLVKMQAPILKSIPLHQEEPAFGMRAAQG